MVAGGNAGCVGTFNDTVGIVGGDFSEDIALPALEIT
jgi:hypothetical protein